MFDWWIAHVSYRTTSCVFSQCPEVIICLSFNKGPHNVGICFIQSFIYKSTLTDITKVKQYRSENMAIHNLRILMACYVKSCKIISACAAKFKDIKSLYTCCICVIFIVSEF